jgi:hypothetical protein
VVSWKMIFPFLPQFWNALKMLGTLLPPFFAAITLHVFRPFAGVGKLHGAPG